MSFSLSYFIFMVGKIKSILHDVDCGTDRQIMAEHSICHPGALTQGTQLGSPAFEGFTAQNHVDPFSFDPPQLDDRLSSLFYQLICHN